MRKGSEEEVKLHFFYCVLFVYVCSKSCSNIIIKICNISDLTLSCIASHLTLFNRFLDMVLNITVEVEDPLLGRVLTLK